MKSRFIGGVEGSEHLISMAKYDFSDFSYRQIVKVWPGQYFAIYRYDEDVVNPIILTQIKILDILAGEQGVCINMIDCKTHDLYRVGHVPSLACGYEVGVAAPQRAYIERTIKEIETGQVFYGVSTGLVILMRNDPTNCTPDIDYMCDWYALKTRFTTEGSYYDEIKRYERRSY